MISGAANDLEAHRQTGLPVAPHRNRHRGLPGDVERIQESLRPRVPARHRLADHSRDQSRTHSKTPGHSTSYQR